jgi:hypothetical protein
LELYKYIPIDICQILYNREKEFLEIYKKTTISVVYFPITITVLPVPVGTPAPEIPSKSILINRLYYKDNTVAEYNSYSTCID